MSTDLLAPDYPPLVAIGALEAVVIDRAAEQLGLHKLTAGTMKTVRELGNILDATVVHSATGSMLVSQAVLTSIQVKLGAVAEKSDEDLYKAAPLAAKVGDSIARTNIGSVKLRTLIMDARVNAANANSKAFMASAPPGEIVYRPPQAPKESA